MSPEWKIPPILSNLGEGMLRLALRLALAAVLVALAMRLVAV